MCKIELTESQEEMRRLLDCGAKRILEMASVMAFSNFIQPPFIWINKREETEMEME